MIRHDPELREQSANMAHATGHHSQDAAVQRNPLVRRNSRPRDTPRHKHEQACKQGVTGSSPASGFL